MPKQSKPRKSSSEALADQLALSIYDPNTEWENIDTGEPVETPPDAEALFYRLAILEGAKRKYAEYEISADDPFAKDKLLAALCSEKWEEFKIPRFVPSPDRLNQMEAWDRSRAEYVPFYAEHQRKPDYGEAAELAWSRWTNCPYPHGEALRQAAVRGRKIYFEYPALKGQTYSSGEYVIVETLKENRALHALDHLADRDECVSIVASRAGGAAIDLPPFALAVIDRLVPAGANMTLEARYPDDIHLHLEKLVHWAVSENEGGDPKYPGGYLLIAAEQGDPCAAAWESALVSAGARVKIRVESALFGRMLDAKAVGKKPDLFFVCLSDYVPPDLLFQDGANGPETMRRTTSYRARRDAEETVRAAAELEAAQKSANSAMPFGGGILSGLVLGSTIGPDDATAP